MILPVPPSELTRAWPIIEPMLQRGIDRVKMERYYPPDFLLQSLRTADKQLWIATDGQSVQAALITTVLKYPSGRKEYEVVVAGGDRLDDWLTMAVDTLGAYAKSIGCSALVGGGRKGWGRVIPDITTNYRFEVEV